MSSAYSREKTALKLSALIAGLFAFFGLIWGLWIGSLMILFDGAYSLISLCLSLLSVYAAQAVYQPASRRFPFGQAAIQPLVIAIKGLAIALVCIVSALAALQSLLSGGRLVSADLALGFALLSLVACAAVWAYLRLRDPIGESDLMSAERSQWQMDTLLSGVVALGFAGAWLMERSAWAEWAVYVDPLLVLAVSGYFLSVPVRMVRGAVRELVMAAPDPKVEHIARNALQVAGLGREYTRVIKLGPYLILDVDISAERHADYNGLRRRLYRALADCPWRPVLFFNPVTDGPVSNATAPHRPLPNAAEPIVSEYLLKSVN
ncbi:cation transporter [Marinimicrobium alkaliphilum]|uniref:cation transporter n=1 Tax=Marinimicrobium alkaliphilum TaxID=2202654 RepID=UPI000DB92469|nr:cation transporter [Marinimicrobium alkaliphilum]